MSYKKLQLDDSTAAAGPDEVMLQPSTAGKDSYARLNDSADGGAQPTDPGEIMLGVTTLDVKPRDFDGFEESRAPLLNRGNGPAYEVSALAIW